MAATLQWHPCAGGVAVHSMQQVRNDIDGRRSAPQKRANRKRLMHRGSSFKGTSRGRLSDGAESASRWLGVTPEHTPLVTSNESPILRLV